jgi:hypothetical protein
MYNSQFESAFSQPHTQAFILKPNNLIFHTLASLKRAAGVKNPLSARTRSFAGIVQAAIYLIGLGRKVNQPQQAVAGNRMRQV